MTTDDTVMPSGPDTRETLALLMETEGRCPNVAVCIRLAADVPEDNPVRTTYGVLMAQRWILHSIESNLAQIVEERTQLQNDNARLREELALAKNVTDIVKQLTKNTSKKEVKKRLSQDPTKKFTAEEGAPHKVQLAYETWENKMISILKRDFEYFDTPELRVGYIGDQCDGKAYNLISEHISNFLKDQSDSKLPFRDWEAMLRFMHRQYVIMDSSQWSKDRLDTFFQNDRAYWSWKSELDELFVKARKTPEQKVDILRSRVNKAMKDMFVTLIDTPADDDYEGWSKIADKFARNISHRDHLDKIDKAKPVLSIPRAPQQSAVTDDPMDLSTARYGPADRLPENVIQHRRDNNLCLACGDAGHQKAAHRFHPVANPNPLPMPPRPDHLHPHRGGRGRGMTPVFPGRTMPVTFPGTLPTRGGWYGQQRADFRSQNIRTQYQNQHQLSSTDFERGQVLGEIISNPPTEADSGSQASLDPSRDSTPSSWLKDTPLH